MNVTLIIVVILFILVCLNEIRGILLKKSDKAQQFIEIMLTISICIILFHVFYSLYIYVNLYKIRGQSGPKGIQGLRGRNGDEGICKPDCGKELCFNKCKEKIEFIMRENKIEQPFQNEFFLRHLDAIIHSDKYENAVNISSEKRIIDYVVETVEHWTKLILIPKELGVEFLTSKESTDNLFDSLSPKDEDSKYDSDKSKNPFDEIKKFEIWGWGHGYTFRPVVRRQCNPIDEMPGSLPAPVNLIFTNNYTNYLVPKPPPTKWGPDNNEECPYGQLGTNYTNPRNIEYCYKYEENTQHVQMVPVWKKLDYISFTKPISFYNIKSAKIANKTYYPVGTVWRGIDKIERAQFTDDIGPDKKTILVTGAKVKQIEKYTLVWPKSEELAHKTGIFVWHGYFDDDEYYSLGDIVTNSRDPPTEYYGIHKDCLEEVSFPDNPIWTTEGLSLIKKEKRKSKGDRTDLKTHLSIWPIGIQDKTEEKEHYTNNTLDKYLNIGYNLFRANSSKDKKPRNKGYTIKSNCTLQVKSKDKDVPNDELGVGWYNLNKKEGRKNEESVYTKLGFTLSGIIKNKKETYYIDFIRSENIDDKFYAIREQDTLGDIKYFDWDQNPQTLSILEEEMDAAQGIPDKFKWTLLPSPTNNKIQLRNSKYKDASIDMNKPFFTGKNYKNNEWDFYPTTGNWLETNSS